MSRIIIRAAAVATLLFSAACSQTPAPIALKGHNVYAKNGAVENTYAYSIASASRYKNDPPPAMESQPVYSSDSYATPVSQSTVQTASVQSIGVSDLAPPAQTAQAAAPQQATAQSEPVNRWTGKPRTEFAQREEKTPDLLAKENKYKPVKLIGAKGEQPASFMWPVNGRKIVSGFGPKGGGKVNDGINIASAAGEPVWAASEGEVIYVGNELKGYGNMVIIKHAGGRSTTYAHLNSATVDKYDRVQQGDIIGYVGSTGNVNAPQLHFAIRDGKAAVDPKKYLSTNLASN